ncbi:uncharacterized protein LOC106774682 [Vigna radiata var. radiata]|uniref:Uncharacterized protein LOC106774682 n=1 Tax=Vigna radiata var. radiata TaxID=3916 RepID=A0A1S3VFS6_VIGRR|nr:uncharacterized protein LOC106774682 [Vigna radiata var. radiata]
MVEGECEEEGGVTVEGDHEEETGEDVGDVRSWTSSGKDDDGNDEVNYECMKGLVDVNVECDLEEDVGDGGADWFGNVQVDVQSDDSDLDDGINSDNDRGLSNDEWKFDELDSGAESDGQDDEEEGYGKYITFSMPKTMMAYCAYMEAIHTWQLRTDVDNHICSREHKLRLLNAKWLSKRLEKTVRENPQVKGMEIRENISRKWNVGVSRCMTYRARAIASDNIDGSFQEQYRKIYDYSNELLARNPGSTVKVKVEETVDEHIFKRFYTCLKACKDSFVSCRPIIGLDGAFMKGKYGGEMLTAVGRDANDQMLPLAYVVVEVENKET